MDVQSLLDLPEEIIVLICRCFRRSTSLQDAWRLLSISRRFCHLAKPVFLEYLTLANRSPDTFCSILSFAPYMFRSTKSLTVTLDLDWPHVYQHNICKKATHREFWNCTYLFDVEGPCTTEGCWKWVHLLPQYPPSTTVRTIEALTRVVPLLQPQLQSFHLSIDPEPRDKEWCCCVFDPLPIGLFTNLLGSVPPSCTKLFLNTGGCDDDSDAEILGITLARKRSTLRHLWIRTFAQISRAFSNNTESFQSQWHSIGSLEDIAFEEWSQSEEVAQEFDSELQNRQPWDSPNAQWDNSDCDFGIYQKWKGLTDERRKGYIDASRGGQKSHRACKPVHWPLLETLIIDRCFCPFVSSVNQTAELEKLALSMTKNQHAYPQLRKCSLLQPQLDQVCEQELVAIQPTQHEWLSTFWEPVSTIVLWDIAHEKTHLLPLLPAISEADFPRIQVSRAEYYMLRDATGTLHCGDVNSLIVVAGRSVNDRWQDTMISQTRTIQDANPEVCCGANDRSWDETVADLATMKYHLRMFLRSWIARTYTHDGLISRLEACWERSLKGGRYGGISNSELKAIVECYNSAVQEPCDRILKLDVGPWLAGMLDAHSRDKDEVVESSIEIVGSIIHHGPGYDDDAVVGQIPNH